MKKYTLERIGMGKIQKDSFVSAFGAEGEDMRTQAVYALESKGIVYGAYNEVNECVCCMPFVKDAADHCAVSAGCFTAEGHNEAEAELKEHIMSEIDSFFLFSFLGCWVIEFEGEVYESYDGLNDEDFGMKKVLVFIVMYAIFHKVFLAFMLTAVFGDLILSILGFKRESHAQTQGSDDIAAL